LKHGKITAGVGGSKNSGSGLKYWIKMQLSTRMLSMTPTPYGTGGVRGHVPPPHF